MRHRGYAEREGEAIKARKRKKALIEHIVVISIFASAMTFFWIGYINWLMSL